jgi:hypothetical protein
MPGAHRSDFDGTAYCFKLLAARKFDRAKYIAIFTCQSKDNSSRVILHETEHEIEQMSRKD